MKAHSLSILALASCLTSSCIYFVDPVPEIPYYPGRPATTPNALTAARTEGAWFTTPPPATPTPPPALTAPRTELPPQSLPAPREAKPAATPPKTDGVQKKPLDLSKPPAVKPATPAKPAPAEKPEPAPDTPKAPALITNDGPIPVATPVPGDPTRVYNPINSKKTIRIVDKDGNIYPSGKELKVRGTNFHFYVP